MIEAGCIARCGMGYLGLVTSDGKEIVHYPDGNTGEAWVGFHLTGPYPGQMWSSRNPVLVLTAEQVQALGQNGDGA